MNKSEQKDRINEVLIDIKSLKAELLNKKPVLEMILSQIDTLNTSFSDLGETEVESWDLDQLKSDVMVALLQNSSMPTIHESLSDFQSDLEAYKDEISESRAEKLDERFEELDSVLEKFDSDAQYDDIDNAIEHFEEAEELLKEMKK